MIWGVVMTFGVQGAMLARGWSSNHKQENPKTKQ